MLVDHLLGGRESRETHPARSELHCMTMNWCKIVARQSSSERESRKVAPCTLRAALHDHCAET